MPRLFDERSAGAVVVDQAFQPVCSGRALQQVSGHAQRAKSGIDKAGQIPQLCVRSPDGIIKGHVVCNDGARADEFLDVAGQLPHGWGICDVSFEIEDSNFVSHIIFGVWSFQSQKLIYCVNSTRILQTASLRI